VEPSTFTTANSKCLTPAFHPRPNVPHVVNLLGDGPAVTQTPSRPTAARTLVRERTLCTDRSWTAQIIARRLVRGCLLFIHYVGGGGVV
jgi:hypothetical protein